MKTIYYADKYAYRYCPEIVHSIKLVSGWRKPTARDVKIILKHYEDNYLDELKAGWVEVADCKLRYKNNDGKIIFKDYVDNDYLFLNVGDDCTELLSKNDFSAYNRRDLYQGFYT